MAFPVVGLTAPAPASCSDLLTLAIGNVARMIRLVALGIPSTPTGRGSKGILNGSLEPIQHRDLSNSHEFA